MVIREMGENVHFEEIGDRFRVILKIWHKIRGNLIFCAKSLTKRQITENKTSLNGCNACVDDTWSVTQND